MNKMLLEGHLDQVFKLSHAYRAPGDLGEAQTLMKLVRRDLRVGISHKLPGDAPAAGPRAPC